MFLKESTVEAARERENGGGTENPSAKTMGFCGPSGVMKRAGL